MKDTKKKILSTIINCAKEYKKELLDKNLLFVCMDKHKKIFTIEVLFNDENYLHLTGCKTPPTISAKDFFSKCISHRLKMDDFEISDDSTIKLKMEVLPLLINKNLSANMAGNFEGNNVKLYTEKLIGGVKACIGFVKTKGGYVPNTVLNTDMRIYVKTPLRIIATYRKNKAYFKYNEMVYKAKNVEWDKICYPKKLSIFWEKRIISKNVDKFYLGITK